MTCIPVCRETLLEKVRKILLMIGLLAPMLWGEITRAAELAIDEGQFVEINGTEQWVTIRGHDAGNPALLFLHGGPGLGLSGMAPIFAEWEKHYTVVHWDQPSSGSTFIRNLERGQGALTVERYVQDGLAVAEFVRQRLKKEKIILMGTSWGSLLGLEMIKKKPTLFAAYVGTAQVVSGTRGNRVGQELAIAAARARNDPTAVEALERIGTPPYRSFEDFLVRQRYTSPPAVPASAAEQAATMAFMKAMSSPPPADAHYVAYKTLPAGFNGSKMFMDTQRAMFQVYGAWEARNLGLKFDVPVFIFQGEDDLNTPLSLAREYFDEIDAPTKGFVTLKGAGHNTLVFHQELLRLLNAQVRRFGS